MTLKKYRYLGPNEEVELPDFGVTVRRGELVEVDGSIKHPHFELHKPKKKTPAKKAATPTPAPAEEVK